MQNASYQACLVAMIFGALYDDLSQEEKLALEPDCLDVKKSNWQWDVLIGKATITGLALLDGATPSGCIVDFDGDSIVDFDGEPLDCLTE